MMVDMLSAKTIWDKPKHFSILVSKNSMNLAVKLLLNIRCQTTNTIAQQLKCQLVRLTTM